ncbi:MAG: flagellar basal body P-ring formation chaperone FlgA [Pseudomonadales bacterium]
MPAHAHPQTPRRAAGWLAALLLAAAGAPEATAAVQDHGAIRAAAEAFALEQARLMTPAEADVRATVSSIDPRLALPACPEPLQTFAPVGARPSARLSVGVRCPGASHWSLYVPVRLEVLMEVVVLVAPAGRGDALTRDHLALERRDVAQLLDGYLIRIEDAEHMELRRPLAVGTVLTTQTVARPILIRRGQRVELVTHSGRFSVRAEGEALGNGAEGDRVRARNVRSRQVVEGVVDPSGRLRVGDPA